MGRGNAYRPEDATARAALAIVSFSPAIAMVRRGAKIKSGMLERLEDCVHIAQTSE
jgi:hypothetical protein